MIELIPWEQVINRDNLHSLSSLTEILVLHSYRFIPGYGLPIKNITHNSIIFVDKDYRMEKQYAQHIIDGNLTLASEYYAKHYHRMDSSYIKKYLNLQKAKKYYYLITFTLRKDMKHLADEAEKYIKKQFTERPPLQIQEAYYVRELTKKGMPHWHVSVCSTTPIAKNRFQYYNKKYGFIDVSKSKQKTLTNGMEYLSKSATPEKLV